jgi:DNA-binding PadR family transcriptional regulator
MHGFGITRRIEQISRGVFRVNPGSLLLAFQRMERQGLITGEWRASESNRRATRRRNGSGARAPAVLRPEGASVS